MSEQIQVPKKVHETLCKIRTSGMTNMFDYNAVMRLAKRFGDPSTAKWVEENFSKYNEGLFQGFIPEEGEQMNIPEIIVTLVQNGIPVSIVGKNKSDSKWTGFTNPAPCSCFRKPIRLSRQFPVTTNVQTLLSLKTLLP